MEMHAFHSRDTFNHMRKFFIPLPDGTITKEWIGVYGRYSDTVVTNRAAFREATIKNAEKGTPELNRAAKITFLAASCGDWSFAHPSSDPSDGSEEHLTPFSVEAMAQFLVDCPHVLEPLDLFLYQVPDFLHAPEV